MTQSQIRFALLALCGLIIGACSQNNHDNRLIFNSFGGHAKVEVYVNSEPVYFGSGMFIFDWNQYPIVHGSNEVIVITRPSAFAVKDVPNIPCIQVAMSDEKGGKLIKEIRYEKDLSKSETNTIAVENLLSNVKIKPYDSLANQSLQALEIDAKEITLKYVEVLLAQGALGLTNILEIKDTKTIESNYSKPLLTGTWDKQFKTERVKDLDDLEVAFGKHLIVVSPSQRYRETNRKHSLFDITELTSNYSFSQNCLILAKRQSDWFMLGGNEPLKLSAR